MHDICFWIFCALVRIRMYTSSPTLNVGRSDWHVIMARAQGRPRASLWGQRQRPATPCYLSPTSIAFGDSTQPPRARNRPSKASSSVRVRDSERESPRVRPS
ncbi:hypothetical protein C8Q76DRAFT_717609 [Earliella scabrosa]|nr:hypothetical protein C8Q76DRAFT_717609 [Earliella scabrosa]